MHCIIRRWNWSRLSRCSPSIDGVSIGKNYATGEVEHRTFNCSLAIYTDERPKFCLERDRNVFLVMETGRMFMLEQYVEAMSI